MYRFLLLLILLGGNLNLKSQANISGEVVDSISGQILDYGTILNLRTLSGTATNLNGFFVLPNTNLLDTLEVSYLGYETKRIVIVDYKKIYIQLNPDDNVIDEVVISASDDRLFDLVDKIRKKKNTKTRNSKTYFFLESKINNIQSEIIESYYNGIFSNHGIEELALKKGRIGIDSTDGRYFLSTGTSRVFIMHDLFNHDSNFPDNPLIFRKRKLKKRYWLSLDYQYVSNSELVTVIDFQPKENYRELFEGKLHVTENGILLKIELRKSMSQLHPYIPFGGISIEGIDMEITKYFKDIDDQQFLSTIDFNYSIHYNDRKGKSVEVESYAYFNAYDYKESFNLPHFEFTPHMHQDYRDITAVPYDSVFWKMFDEFRFFDKLNDNEQFVLNHQIDNSFVLSDDPAKNYQLEFPYISWSPYRFSIKPLSDKEIFQEKQKTVFDSDKYNLNTKLYLDINYFRDTMVYQLVSILDPVNTYYKMSINSQDLTYMNMYFDLLEYHRIMLATELTLSKDLTIEQASQLLKSRMEVFLEEANELTKETRRGKNTVKMLEWNDYISELVGVQNISIKAVREGALK